MAVVCLSVLVIDRTEGGPRFQGSRKGGTQDLPGRAR